MEALINSGNKFNIIYVIYIIKLDFYNYKIYISI